ncbi:MAG: HAD family phosphatase [Cryobacterium sp.]
MNLIPEIPDTPAAVLWDMDGTLVDTEPYWMVAETELVESFGGTWTHADCMLLIGSGLWASAVILQDRGVEMEPDDIVQWLTNRVQDQLRVHGVPWRPGARDMLAELKEAGIPMALVTMSVERMARQIADLIGFEAFDTIIAGDMVTHSKPHPEAYLAAAALLGVSPEHCVAVEDSPPGVAAAVASGAVVIAVPHQLELPESVLYTLWPTLAGQSVAGLTELFNERRRAAERIHLPAHTGHTIHEGEATA